MESRENPLFGRKVFFINPSLFIENLVVEMLREQEYEVYVLSDFRRAKSLLAQFPDSLCFVDIDTEMNFSQWFNFIKSFSNDNNLTSLFFGVISEKANFEDRNRFLMNLKLPCGFTLVRHKSDKIVSSFVDILELNGAKGRRKYLRLDTKNIKEVSGYLAAKDKLFAVNIRDISSVGFSCTFKKELAPLFQEKTLLRNICLNVGRKSLVCSCVVFRTTFVDEATGMSVLMLTNENPPETKIQILTYIIDYNNEVMSVAIKNAVHDSFSYAEPDIFSTLPIVHSEEYDDLLPL